MRIAYDRHDLEWRRVLEDPERQRVGESWFSDDTLDAWRHRRMRSFLRPLIERGRAKSWLTVGDGRFGTDAHHLIAAGVADVTATDLSDELLRIGAERGFIGKFAAQNAEALTFPDESFDFVYSKECYHHLPRPYLAVYEMLRVCRPGGRLALASWTREGFVGGMFGTTARFNPPPEGVPSPLVWGSEEGLARLFSGKKISCERRYYVLHYLSADEWFEFFRTRFGPMVKTFAALDAGGQREYEAAMLDLARRANRSGDDTLVISAEYLEAIVTV